MIKTLGNKFIVIFYRITTKRHKIKGASWNHVKKEYDSNQYFEDDFIEDDESYESEENIDSYDNLIEDGFDYWW